MGRRPNAVVGEFFHRGQKLDDNSNRYQHTCKKCGAHFAKGRIDSMLNHLLKRCAGMTQDDRDLAFLHMQHSNGPAKTKKHTSSSQADQQNAGRSQPQMPVDAPHGVSQQVLPSDPGALNRYQMPQMPQQGPQGEQTASAPLQTLMQRQKSALDTLAEVSHRHMNYSVTAHEYATVLQRPTTARQADRGLLEHTLLAALQHQNMDEHSIARSVEPTTLPMYPAYIAQAQTLVEPTTLPNGPISLPLIHTATAATNHLDQDQFQPEAAPIDPQLDESLCVQGPTLAAQHREAPRQTQHEFVPWTEAPQEFVTQQDPPSNEPNPEFGTAQKSEKSNARARFTDTRRKEVQEIRKRGACMRCRMLKKPCSEGTPCSTCKKIDSARLWKGTCLRSKLAEEFTLYSMSYFHSIMVTRVSGSLHTLNSAPLPGRIEIKLARCSTFAMEFSTKRYSRPTSAQRTDHDRNTPSGADDIIALDDGMIPQKVSVYCMNNMILQECIRDEQNSFLQATLREAMVLLEFETTQELPSSTKPRSRTNHISPSVLLSNVIELWIETNLLIRSRQEPLQIRYKPDMPSSQDSQVISWIDDTSQRLLSPNSTGHNLICLQVMAATETACDRLSKAVINELERRLLQRQQVSAFATFISAMILLSCIERISSFYHSLDPSSSPRTATAIAAISSFQSSQDPRSPGYPTTVPPPSVLWPQGSHFARLLTTLLRMRALPPKTTLTADNRLAVLQEPVPPVRMNGVAARGQQDAETTRAANWLDPLRLDVDELRARRDSDTLGGHWDMRFISAVLLSEDM